MRSTKVGSTASTGRSRCARRGFAWRRVAAASILAALLAAPATASQEDAIAGRPGDSCAPLADDDDRYPDLQQAALAVCRALFPEPVDPEGLAARLRIRVGGWADASYRNSDLDGRGDSYGLDHLNLHLDARLDDRWQLFVEGEYDHDRDVTGFRDERELELEQAWVEGVASDALHVRLGKFSTPFGYWTPVHWAINVDTIEEPIHEENRLIPEQQLGGRLFGRFFVDRALGVDPQLEYSLYAGYGEDGLDTGNPEGPTGGADLRLWLDDLHLLGSSVYAQSNAELDDRREVSLMLYGQAALPWNLLFRTEYLSQWRESRPGLDDRVDVLYAKLRWAFHPNAWLNYRFSYGEDDTYGFTADHTIHTVTLGWRPIPPVVGKVETSFHDLDQGIESYVAWAASIGLLF